MGTIFSGATEDLILYRLIPFTTVLVSVPGSPS